MTGFDCQSKLRNQPLHHLCRVHTGAAEVEVEEVEDRGLKKAHEPLAEEQNNSTPQTSHQMGQLRIHIGLTFHRVRHGGAEQVAEAFA